MPKEKKSEEEIIEETTDALENALSQDETEISAEAQAALDTEIEAETATTEEAEVTTPVFENIETPTPEEPQDFSSDRTVTVQPVKFASFEDAARTPGEANKNLDILMDIKLQLTVELGRTELPIKKVLELTRGSIIELEKVAGEPVELYANGKLVAHGEVVVIEDNFGLRVTSITDPEERLKGI